MTGPTVEDDREPAATGRGNMINTLFLGEPPEADLGAVARRVRANRQRRNEIFALPVAIFHEPAWDIMLDLFIAHADGGAPDFGDMCAHADVQGPTALRWITTLEQMRLVQAIANPVTGAPGLHLTDRGVRAMRDYLSEI